MTTSDSSASLVTSRPTVATTRQQPQTFSYTIVGDNVDRTVSPRYMTTDSQRRSLHYFHAYCAMDRINFRHLANDEPIADVSSLTLSTFLPNLEDSNALRSNYAILLGREVVQSLPFF